MIASEEVGSTSEELGLASEKVGDAPEESGELSEKVGEPFISPQRMQHELMDFYDKQKVQIKVDH